MEGNDNSNTAGNERAVRPVRQRTGGPPNRGQSRNAGEAGQRRKRPAERSEARRSSVEGRRPADGTEERRSSGSRRRPTDEIEERRSSGGRRRPTDETEERRPSGKGRHSTDETEVGRSSGGRRRPADESGVRRSSEGRRRPTDGTTEERRSSGTRRRPADGNETRRPSSREGVRPVKRREEQTGDRGRNRGEEKPDLTKMAVNPMVIGATAAVLLLAIAIIVGVRSCGASHRSAANVVKALISASVEGNTGGMKEAYGINGDVMVDMQEAFDASTAFYKAHNAKKVDFGSSGTLFEEGDYVCIYVLYHLILDNDQAYPCISTYITQNIEGKYYVLAPSKVTEDLSQKAADAYSQFMTTETYKNYAREYDTFIKKNPGYEDKIALQVAV